MMRGEPGGGENTLYRADGTYVPRARCRHGRCSMKTGRTTHFVVIRARRHRLSCCAASNSRMQNERLTALTSIARGLFASLEPQGARRRVARRARRSSSALKSELCWVARPNGGFAATSRPRRFSETAPGDRRSVPRSGRARSDATSIAGRERRSGPRSASPGSLVGKRATYSTCAARRPLHTADIFALGLLGQYFAVAARNVELYHELQRAGRPSSSSIR